MIITEAQREELIKWIKESYDTNDFCERSLLVDAFLIYMKYPRI